MVKFKTRPVVVDAFRIEDPSIGQVGSWMVMKDGKVSKILSNPEFVEAFRPSGRGESKAAYEMAKAEVTDAAPKPALAP